MLAGPGEGWKVDDNGNYVGVTTGRPVLRLEDLVVALRTVENARQGGISVSIDPTAEGRQQFERYMRTQKTFNPAVLGGIEKALGPAADQHHRAFRRRATSPACWWPAMSA